MNISRQKTPLLWLSLPLTGILIFNSVVALTTPGFYSLETTNWQVQSIGQDYVDLFLVVPVLILTTWFVYKDRGGALLVWAGVNLYIVYTFIIYCFDIHFNRLFIFYCFGLGLTFYSSLWFFYKIFSVKKPGEIIQKIPYRLTGFYFIVIAVLFYFLWMSEVLPAVINNEIPASVNETGLFTNAVHVLDLSVVLPGIFLTGIFLVKGKFMGYLLAPAVLTFFILMDITIAVLDIMMKQKGLEGSYGLAIVIFLLALFSGVLLILHIKTMKNSEENFIS